MNIVYRLSWSLNKLPDEILKMKTMHLMGLLDAKERMIFESKTGLRCDPVTNEDIINREKALALFKK